MMLKISLYKVIHSGDEDMDDDVMKKTEYHHIPLQDIQEWIGKIVDEHGLNTGDEITIQKEEKQS